MDKSNNVPGPKVSQMANLFQKKQEEEDEKVTSGNAVVRTESHAARFNNARALFERLGESRVNRPASFSLKHSTSKDDNLKDPSPDRERTPSPPKKKSYTNGINKNEIGMIHNVSRKTEKPEKPEKPERKFNSKELIEKQKNWTSHFSKPRTTAAPGMNRCDIIRTVPGTGVISNADLAKSQEQTREAKPSRSSSIELPSSPTNQKHSPIPPEVKPRTTSRSSSLSSPTKSPLPNLPGSKSSPQRLPDGIESHSLPPDISSRRYSSDRESNSLNSPAHVLSSNASSSGPSSPVHTEDEKQENESNEKTDLAVAAVEGEKNGNQTKFELILDVNLHA